MEIDNIVKVATEIMLNDGQLPLTLLVEGEKETAIIPRTDGNKETSHQDWAYMVGISVAMSGRFKIFHQIATVTEAWMAAMPADTAIEDAPPPSEHPDRKEIILIHLQDVFPGKKSRMRILDIIRNEDDENSFELVEDISYQKDGGEAQSSILDNFLRGYLSKRLTKN